MKKKLLSGILTLLVLLGTIAVHPTDAQTDVPRFEPEPCATFEVSKDAPNAVEGVDVECGYLVVPEQRVTPTDRTIKLGIVIIKSTSDNPKEPLVMAQGGPGGSSIELYRNLAEPGNADGEMLRADRDLIAFEQRGTRYSQPFLFCQEGLDLTLRGFQEDFSDAEEERLAYQAYDGCKNRLASEGVNLAAFNSEENAHDVADLAKVLGTQQINFYGVSYGTMLGQHLVRLHPEVVRSFILDAIVPLNVNAFQKAAESKNRSLNLLFAACAADANCNRYYPDLEKVFYETVDQLNRSPVPMNVSDIETATNYPTELDGDGLIGIVGELFYATDAIPALPKLIYDARAGQVDLPEIVTSLLAIDRSMSEGMYYSVTCAEEYFYQEPEVEGVRPVIADEERRNTQLINEVCADWNVPRLDSAADAPVVSDIPALLFSGNFDPITPPPYGEEVASHLSKATRVVFPVNGHGALNGECAVGIVRDFLNDPQAAPDTSCAASPASPQFITPAAYLTSSGATYLLRLAYRTAFEPTNVQNIVDAVQALAFRALILGLLLLFPFVWLIRWLVNLKKPGEKRWPARLAPWLMVAWLAAAAGFVGLLLFGVEVTTFGGSLFTAVAGISRQYQWIFALPWLAAFVTVALIVLAILAWLKSYWGVLARIYFSLSVLLAVIYIISLAGVGVFGVLFS